jgi:hypothetical protein
MRPLAQLAVLVILSAVGFAQQGPPRPAQPKTQPKPAVPKIHTLSIDEVLSWRSAYEDLLGKDSAVARERYGQPPHEYDNELDFDGSDKTDGHEISLFIRSGKVTAVKVFANPLSEYLDVLSVIVRAPNFCFSSGTFTDSTDNYFMAESKDGRNSLQFQLYEGATLVAFQAAIFDGEPIPCDPEHPARPK